jgi:hypothetical protein
MGATDGRFAVEVIADTSEQWTGNGIRFGTQEEAEAYAKDLWSRWTAVRSWRIVETVVAGWFMFKSTVRVSA